MLKDVAKIGMQETAAARRTRYMVRGGAEWKKWEKNYRGRARVFVFADNPYFDGKTPENMSDEVLGWFLDCIELARKNLAEYRTENERLYFSEIITAAREGIEVLFNL